VINVLKLVVQEGHVEDFGFHGLYGIQFQKVR